jgi:Rad3-related DNA helicase
MYATIDLGPDSVPVWGEVTPPAVDDLEDAAAYADRLAAACDRELESYRGTLELAAEDVAARDRLQELKGDLQWFAKDYRDPESPTTWVVDQPDGAGSRVTIKPLNPERYLQHTVWDRGQRFALLSATILNKEAFCAGVGLDPDRVALVEVPHTFPVAHRPLFDVTQGKMTYEERDETIPAIARLLVRLMAEHPEEAGLVHCHSYAIQDRLADHLADFGVDARVRTHDRADRDGQLAAWKRSDDPDVFLSVKMEEALDLEGDRCRWQVLCKAPYPNTRDSRVSQRLADGQWAWYYRVALRTIIQACGRIVRSPDDYGATYLADDSILDVFDRARSDTPDWFRDQVDRMARPDLPAFDPAAALRGVDETAGGAGRSARQRGGGSAASTGDQASGTGGGGTPSGRTQSSDHPLTDVWD